MWVDEFCLIDVATGQVDEDIVNMRVADAWDEGTGWKWSLFAHLIPVSCLVRIAGMRVDRSSGREDAVGWLSNDKTKFSVKTAYNIQLGLNVGEGWPG